MNSNLDEEILQDFLLEAGEILEQLSEQLIGLENTPDDIELFNAIFRGYHTIKGGAGFLGADALVAVCHRCEDIFNLLRSQKLKVNAELMDVILEGLDSVNDMFAELGDGSMPTAAKQSLLDALDQLMGQQEASDNDLSEVPLPPPESEELISGSEVDALLDGVGADAELIEDDEFEALLDEMHGKGKSPGVVDEQITPATVTAEAATDATSTAGKAAVITKPKKESTLRVETARLDRIMNMVGEMVLVRNRLMTLRGTQTDSEISKAIANLDLITGDLQDAVMKTRMQPVKKIFGRFPRVVRDMARSLNKEIELVLEGEETDLDKNLIEALADPLVHLVRNAVDHGIEMPDEREAAGKPRQGRVVLSASQTGEFILLSIHDDGHGMDPEILRQKAVEKGILDEAAASSLSDKECFELIFAAGFSTKSEISDISGRGVGMDVVKTEIQKINGIVDIESELGRGTRVVVKVPLTLAIMPTLMVRLSNQIFAFPLGNVVETLDISAGETRMVDGQRIMILRERALPLVMLNEWFHQSTPDIGSTGQVVVLSMDSKEIGFVVEHLIGQEEVVIKPLGSLVQGMDGFSGATITGDGHIALVLDVPSLINRYA